MSTIKSHWASHRDAAMVVFVAAVFILAVVWSVFSATTIGDNINTGGTLTVSGVSNVSHLYASSTVQATLDGIFYANVGVGTTSAGSRLAVNGPGIFVGTSTVFGGLNLESISATGTLGFYTRGTAAPRVLIDSSGNVGVATSGPGALLSVAGAGLFTATSTILSGGLITEGVTAPGILGFYTRGTAAPRLVIDSSGNLGVATSGPTTTFSVTGSGYFTAGLGVGYATTGSGNLLVNDLAVIRGRAGVFATTTPYHEFGVAGDAAFGGAIGTGTISVETTTSARGGCIELRDSDGAWVSIYAGKGSATSTTAHYVATGNQLGAGAGLTTILVIQQGRCETAPD